MHDRLKGEEAFLLGRNDKQNRVEDSTQAEDHAGQRLDGFSSGCLWRGL